MQQKQQRKQQRVIIIQTYRLQLVGRGQIQKLMNLIAEETLLLV